MNRYGHIVRLEHPADFETFRRMARRLVAAGISSHRVLWTTRDDAQGVLATMVPAQTLPEPSATDAPRAPRRFVELARLVACHSAADRYILLHRLLERFQKEPRLLSIATDADVARATTLAQNVRRCAHKMKAFVRFRTTRDRDGAERFVAWFEPEHHVLDLVADFFVGRFAAMRWSIVTPERSAHWDGATLIVAGGASREIAPDGDIHEDLWRTYFGAIFNPARLNVRAMTSEMPKRYWTNLPEAALIQPLIRQATARAGAMMAAPATAPARSTRPARARREAESRSRSLAANINSLDDIAEAAAGCTRCPLYRDATQVVMGEGRPGAAIMFVGEQPGDQEDLAGRPFVGPAGRLLNRALQDAGIERADTFVTNAVKHFKFEVRGKRRIHKSPNAGEIEHCRVWLDHERRLVRPKVTVALGASAARTLAGHPLAVGRNRGTPLTWADGSAGFLTVHPSALLRLADAEAKRAEYRHFVDDLAAVRTMIATVTPKH
ncbi:UdgX family uracil-DNA binding protein [Acuticoccus mangrovi]|uniref:Type-4 uracil-DNA glycosylase n=1 Tax=Acuticoccus mangrovi TaxID=2796142 RepID=A0A934ICP8_9HYPH|nr:UdgX family uracil-DNA binding protein [Acuticoccus mangrovi]MBJ3774109.1 UdgX family uracil-DNA binding protein [Acuticoccus mangrovi]